MTMQKIDTTNVSDLAKDQTFIVDTNILYFIHSGYYSNVNSKNRSYSNFIQKLITNGNKLIISVASMQELFYGIENKEFLLYCNKNNLNKKRADGSLENPFSKKDFRSDSVFRKAVQMKLRLISKELKVTYNLSDFTIMKEQVEDFLIKYDSHRYDPIDFFVVNNMIKDSHINFITDDCDFTYDPNINVFTL